MKTKIRQIIAIILALCAILCLAACGDSKEQKWLLTYEKRQSFDEQGNPYVIREVYFEYDASGKMITKNILKAPQRLFRQISYMTKRASL